MSERYQRVEPTPFDAAPEESVAASAPGSGDTLARLALPGLAVLVAAALFVFLLLPRLVDRDGTAPVVADRPAASPATGVAAPERAAGEDEAASPDASPYADALEARARAEAQELLEELIDVRENLEARGALEWAPGAMEGIAAAATRGDEQYRERAFDAAIDSYREALDSAIALEGSLPARFQQALEATDAAIEALDVEGASRALERARLLEPGAPELAARDERTAVLPELIEAVEAARAAEAENDLAAAVDSLRGAREKDPAHRAIGEELRRLEAALTAQRFNAAMSEGYAALEAEDFERARGRFDAATRLRPDSDEAAAALRELAVARTAARLRNLQARAREEVAAEDWPAAIALYEEALSIDDSLRFAREGLARALPRAKTQKALDAIIEAPERLVDDAILREARASLRSAEAIADPGPRLRERLARVREIIAVASTPLAVQLRSDGETAVTVYKVARLGTFEERELELRPGTYVAVGRRDGYRDARVEFTVTPERRGPVMIACTEPIAFR